MDMRWYLEKVTTDVEGERGRRTGGERGEGTERAGQPSESARRQEGEGVLRPALGCQQLAWPLPVPPPVIFAIS